MDLLLLSKPPGLALDLTALLRQREQQAHLLPLVLLLGFPMKSRPPQAQPMPQTTNHWPPLAVRCRFLSDSIQFQGNVVRRNLLQCLCCHVSNLGWQILPCICSSLYDTGQHVLKRCRVACCLIVSAASCKTAWFLLLCCASVTSVQCQLCIRLQLCFDH